MGVVEVATPVGEDNGQGAGDEGDDPDARLAVAAVQEADQGEEEKESKEDVKIPEIIGSIWSQSPYPGLIRE